MKYITTALFLLFSNYAWAIGGGGVGSSAILNTKLQGYVSNPGAVSSTDTILQAFDKIGAGGSGGLSAFTTFGSTPNANGGSVSGSNIILQPADATRPGGVNAVTQSFGGGKTVIGNANEIQLKVKGNATQTAHLVDFQTSNGGTVFNITQLASGNGASQMQGSLEINGQNDQNELSITSFAGQVNPIAVFNDIAGGSTTINPDATFTFDDGNGTTVNIGPPGLTLSTGPAFNGTPASYLTGSSGNLTSLSSQIIGGGKTFRGQTIENILAVADSYTCSVSPTITLEDCGTVISCASPTALGSVNPTVVNTMTGGTISTADIPANHFWRWKISSGTCTALMVNVNAEAAAK